MLTESEKAFVRRMIPHMAAGKSFADAAALVIEDDQRIAAVVLGRGRQNEAIRSHLAEIVYQRITGER